MLKDGQAEAVPRKLAVGAAAATGAGTLCSEGATGERPEQASRQTLDAMTADQADTRRLTV
jgi:hypothetical protein